MPHAGLVSRQGTGTGLLQSLRGNRHRAQPTGPPGGPPPTWPSTYLSPVMVMVKPSYSFPWSLRLGTLVFTVNPSFVLVLNCFRGGESSRYARTSRCEPPPAAVRGGLDACAPGRSLRSWTRTAASSDGAQAPARTPRAPTRPQAPASRTGWGALTPGAALGLGGFYTRHRLQL